MIRVHQLCRIVAFFAIPAAAATLLEQRIDQLFRTTHAAEPAGIGIHVVQLGTGKILYSRDAERLFIPASNTKLFSTALALVRLGPNHHMPTRIYAAQKPDAEGYIKGDVTLAGGGDPSMSSIQIPYDKDAQPADPIAAIEAFADQIVALGVRHISGDIVGDDTLYPADPFPPGWAIDDAKWLYGAPVSALSLGCNAFTLTVTGGAAEGDPAALDLVPRFEYYTLDNRVRTVTGGDPRVEVNRLNGLQLQLTGSVPAGQQVELSLAVDDPALYAATALHDALTRRGIRVGGRPSARHRSLQVANQQPARTLLVERSSPPLLDVLRVVDKVSQNLWAEMLLREVGNIKRGEGTREAGLAELQAFLKEIGINDNDYVFEDGSGLSRLTLVKPLAVVTLLRYMHQSDLRDAWISVLPIGGEDGTLKKRFGKDPIARNIHAKTGSLTHVNALSGYADSATYGELAFSIIVNQTNAPTAEVRDFLDKIGKALLE